MSKRKNNPQEIPENLELFSKSFLMCMSSVHCRGAEHVIIVYSHQLLLDWLKKSGYHPALYALCTSYPRKPLLTAADVSLEDAGILGDTVLNVEEKDPSTTQTSVILLLNAVISFSRLHFMLFFFTLDTQFHFPTNTLIRTQCLISVQNSSELSFHLMCMHACKRSCMLALQLYIYINKCFYC